MTVTIEVDNRSFLLFFGLIGIFSVILIFTHLKKKEKSVNPFTLIGKFFKLIFKTEIKTDTGRVNLFFGICSFLYVFFVTAIDNPINDLVPNNNPITSELLYFLIAVVTVIFCVFFVSKHESILSDKTVKDEAEDTIT